MEPEPAASAAESSSWSRSFTARSASSSNCPSVAAWEESISRRRPVVSARASSAAWTPRRAFARRARSCRWQACTLP
eukprot:11711061-Alexandrium_andersonii.AAC.1